MIRLQRRWRRRIALSYGLLTLETAASALYPALLGRAVDGLSAGAAAWLTVFGGLALLHLALATARRLLDTRVFARANAALAARLGARLGPSSVGLAVGRGGMTRELIRWLEVDCPEIVQRLVVAVVALAALAAYDLAVAGLTIAAVAAAGGMALVTGVRSRRLGRALNDELEREAAVLGTGERRSTFAHYREVARWRVRLSDLEAWSTAGVLAVGIALLVGATLLLSRAAARSTGDILAVLIYVIALSEGIAALPEVAQQWSRGRDVALRLDARAGDAAANA